MNILATDTADSLSDMVINDAGCISDHLLVHANMIFIYQSTFCNIKKVVSALFDAVLQELVLFSSPPNTVDALMDQTINVITEKLDKVAQLKRCARRPSKPSTKWPSDEAISVKREGRRFNRRWKSTHCEIDCINYHCTCHRAYKLINELWYATSTGVSVIALTPDNKGELPGSSSTQPTMTWPDLMLITTASLCLTFSEFFLDKIGTLKDTIHHKVISFFHPTNTPDFHSLALY